MREYPAKPSKHIHIKVAYDVWKRLKIEALDKGITLQSVILSKIHKE